MNQPITIDYNAMPTPSLRKEVKLRIERYQIRARASSDEDRLAENGDFLKPSNQSGVGSMSRKDLLNTLKEKPALGRHEYGTLRSLHLGLLDYESAPDPRKHVEKMMVSKIPPNNLPLLYVDHSTVLERVLDLTLLRAGDHVLVGLNPLRKIWRPFDRLLQRLAHAEVLSAYHHFVMFDDVRSVDDATGEPLNGEGEKAMICEYSNTPGGAISQAWAAGGGTMLGFLPGLKNVWDHPAPFQRIPLSDYVEGACGRFGYGIFRVKEDLTDEDRAEIVENCKRLMTSYESYSIWYRNCEHAAFALNPKTPKWVSPQVPYLMWNMFRFMMNVGGVALLMSISQGRSYFTNDHVFNILVALYHFLTTVPAVLQSVIQLCRTVMALTKRKERGLDSQLFYHLLYKEFLRAVLAGGLAAVTLGLMPQMVWDTGYRLAPVLMVLFAYSATNVLYSVSCWGAIRLMLMRDGGVSVPMLKVVGREALSPRERRVMEEDEGGRGRGAKKRAKGKSGEKGEVKDRSRSQRAESRGANERKGRSKSGERTKKR